MQIMILSVKVGLSYYIHPYFDNKIRFGSLVLIKAQ